jgi:hypothetical protein
VKPLLHSWLSRACARIMIAIAVWPWIDMELSPLTSTSTW